MFLPVYQKTTVCIIMDIVNNTKYVHQNFRSFEESQKLAFQDLQAKLKEEKKRMIRYRTRMLRRKFKHLICFEANV